MKYFSFTYKPLRLRVILHNQANLKRLSLIARFSPGPLRKRPQFRFFFLKSYLAPRLKVKVHNKRLPSTSLLQLLFTAMVKQLHFSLTFHQINYNHIIILSFPLPKDPFSIQKDNVTLKVLLISGVSDSQIC